MEPSDYPTLERCFKGHQKAVNSVHFNPDMKQLVSGGDDNFVMVWHFQNQMRAFRYVGHKKPVNWVRFSPNGGLIASASNDNTVRLWIPTIKGDSNVIKCHSAPVQCVEFSSDTSNIVTSSNDKSIKLWDVIHRKFITSYSEHKNWVRSVCFNGSDSVIMSGGDDHCVKLWDKRAGNCIKTIDELSGRVVAVAFQPPSDEYVAASFDDGSVRLWDLRNYELIQLYVNECNRTKMAIHPSGNYIVTATGSSLLKILDLLEGRAIYSIQNHQGSFNCVSYSGSGEYLAAGSSEKQVLVWKCNFSKTLKRRSPKVSIAETVKKGGCDGDSSESQTPQFPVQPNHKQPTLSDKKQHNSRSDERHNPPCALQHISPNVERMESKDDEKKNKEALHDLASQMDVLIQTVTLLEKRISFMEEKFDQLLSVNEHLRSQQEQQV